MSASQDTSAARAEAQKALYEAITEAVVEVKEARGLAVRAEGLKNLAEAYAWLTSTAQPH